VASTCSLESQVLPITCSCSETCEITTKEIPSASTFLYKEHFFNKHEEINGRHVCNCVIIMPKQGNDTHSFFINFNK
jgi:hypothetical protein